MRDKTAFIGRHICTVCGRRDNWGDSWQWYGSLRDQEDGKAIIKTCSDKCRSLVVNPANILRLLNMGAKLEFPEVSK